MKSTLYLFLGAIAVWSVLGACSSVEETGPDSEDTKSARPLLAEDRLTTAAAGHAAHLIRDGEVRQTQAEPLAYAEANGRIPGATRPQPIPDDEPVWIVTLKGLFYLPAGPPLPPDWTSDFPDVPTSPTCNVIKVLLDDATRDYIRLTIEPASAAKGVP